MEEKANNVPQLVELCSSVAPVVQLYIIFTETDLYSWPKVTIQTHIQHYTQEMLVQAGLEVIFKDMDYFYMYLHLHWPDLIRRF